MTRRGFIDSYTPPSESELQKLSDREVEAVFAMLKVNGIDGDYPYVARILEQRSPASTLPLN